jgi:hypothetical protein
MGLAIKTFIFVIIAVLLTSGLMLLLPASLFFEEEKTSLGEFLIKTDVPTFSIEKAENADSLFVSSSLFSKGAVNYGALLEEKAYFNNTAIYLSFSQLSYIFDNIISKRFNGTVKAGFDSFEMSEDKKEVFVYITIYLGKLAGLAKLLGVKKSNVNMEVAMKFHILSDGILNVDEINAKALNTSVSDFVLGVGSKHVFNNSDYKQVVKDIVVTVFANIGKIGKDNLLGENGLLDDGIVFLTHKKQ